MGTLIQKMACQPGPGGQRTAEEDSGCDTEAADGTPQGECRLALGAGVGGHHQRQRRGGEECGAQALDGARRDELAAGVGEPADQRGDGEQAEPGQEHATPGEQVGDPASEEQAAAGHHQVGGDQPLQLAALEVQGAADGGQGGVDDRDVQDDQDLGGQGDGQQRPGRLGAAVLVAWLRHGAGVLAVVGAGGGRRLEAGRCVTSDRRS